MIRVQVSATWWEATPYHGAEISVETFDEDGTRLECVTTNPTLYREQQFEGLALDIASHLLQRLF